MCAIRCPKPGTSRRNKKSQSNSRKNIKTQIYHNNSKTMQHQCHDGIIHSRHLKHSHIQNMFVERKVISYEMWKEASLRLPRFQLGPSWGCKQTLLQRRKTPHLTLSYIHDVLIKGILWDIIWMCLKSLVTSREDTWFLGLSGLKKSPKSWKTCLTILYRRFALQTLQGCRTRGLEHCGYHSNNAI